MNGSDSEGGMTAALSEVHSVYEIPEDDLVGEVLVPAMSCADEVRIGAGFFTSESLAQIAPGLASYLSNSEAPIQLLISPAIADDDRAAISAGLETPEEVMERASSLLFEGALLSESRVVQHALDCLAYLLAARRLEIRFVLMPEGQYHKKLWLLRAGSDWVGVHGSGNVTARGLLVNGEQMTIDREWCDGERAKDRLNRLRQRWDRQWSNRQLVGLTLTAKQALAVLARRKAQAASADIPTTRDFWEAWRADSLAGLAPELPPGLVDACDVTEAPQLALPDGLELDTGRFAHQGRAIRTFLSAHGKGVLAIATGGGKTKTALAAATTLQDQSRAPFLVVILVPSTPLMRQWADECAFFGITPHVLSELSPNDRRARLGQVQAALSVSTVRTEVLVVTNQLFAKDPDVRTLIEGTTPNVKTMVIGDEVHNLGAASFISNPPERFDYRLGLSATPVRQYDPDGSTQLLDYFGGQIFEFSLLEAISAGCLVPYSYYLHEVRLNDQELDNYSELTAKLIEAGFSAEDDGRTVGMSEYVKRLLFARRSVLENAADKLEVLGSLLSKAVAEPGLSRTLIYASAKKQPAGYPRQISEVNRLLRDLGVISHQLTSAETRSKLGSELLEKFGRGEYQVLTAMKVLDEGVDIPQTDTAYLLASSTVKREWVQRRGRVLRAAPGKTGAVVHDFLVVPENLSESASRSILKSELARAQEFATLATNEWDRDGPRMAVISKYESIAWS